MEYRIVYLPPFTAATSGVDPEMDFSENGRLGRFDAYFSGISPQPRDSVMPRDFLFFDPKAGGFEWWYALEDGMPDGGFKRVEFEGGYYLTYAYRDGDEDERARQHQAAVEHIEKSGIFALDERKGHYAMGHIITPEEIIAAQGYGVMEIYLPIRLK